MPRQILLSLMLALTLSPAAADTWRNQTEDRTDRAFWEVVVGDRSLSFGCFRGEQSLGMTFVGGAEQLPASAREAQGVMIWIELPDGRTGRYPMDTEYLGGPENALIGTLQLGQQGIEFFAAGRELRISDPSGTELFVSGMTGTSAARQDFQRTCGF